MQGVADNIFFYLVDIRAILGAACIKYTHNVLLFIPRKVSCNVRIALCCVIR